MRIFVFLVSIVAPGESKQLKVSVLNKDRKTPFLSILKQNEKVSIKFYMNFIFE